MLLIAHKPKLHTSCGAPGPATCAKTAAQPGEGEGGSLPAKDELGPRQEGPSQTSALAFELSPQPIPQQKAGAGAPILGWEGGRNCRVPPGEIGGLFHAMPGLLLGKRSLVKHGPERCHFD